MSVQLLKPAGLHLMTSRTDTALNGKGWMPWYGYFAWGGPLYRSCRCAVRGFDLACSGMDLRHQCAGGILLYLESLDTRETKRR